MATGKQEHWSRVYAEKDPQEVSWYQQSPAMSLTLIKAAIAGIYSQAARPLHILDVGGGASTFVDSLLDDPDIEPCVLDITARAFDHARARLGRRADRARWIEADATGGLAEIDSSWADVWHDRAVFHFLTTPQARFAYAKNLARILRPGGAAIVSTFAPDGPTKCSGLEVCRHDGASILRELTRGGAVLTLEKEKREQHTTPWGADQSFVYVVLRRG
jgi:SAM-dependent methyltransferase